MNTPLWYQVYNHELSFKEFLDRYNDRKFQERDVLPIFVLSVIYNHDPYIGGIHVLNILMGDRGITERALKYFYLYWAVGKGFSNDTMLAGNDHGGTFRQINIRLPIDFSAEYIFDWIRTMLMGCFNDNTIIPVRIMYERGNNEILMKSLEYGEKALKDRFEIQAITIEKTYKLGVAHSILVEIIQFLRSGTYPGLLKYYRNNIVFFRNVVASFCPVALKSMDNESPLTEEEIRVVDEEHQRLYETLNINFFIYYIKSLTEIFDKEHIIIQVIEKYFKPSKENDKLKAGAFLKSLDPDQRRTYIPQYLPVTDVQLSEFVRCIQKEGVVTALTPYILNNKKLIQDQLRFSGCELVNDTIIGTHCSVFLYTIDQLILHIEGNKLHIFLPEELSKFPGRENPFNRQILPDYLFATSFEGYITENLEEIWSKIVRHAVDLQSIINGQ